MPWIPTPNGGPGYTCTHPGCGYVTGGDPADIGRHRLEHLAKMLQEAPALTPPAAIEQAEEILREDLERARKLWYPTR
ncbi:hypothetical protein LCGC14_1930550 [marine sediment metagenome]|uniref:Uncharacterized protein n=1 Tax=marine sediment metagenome TaxID=412755 RepID=A0A0F9FNP9_9ZZZZ